MSHEMERFLFKNHYPTSIIYSMLKNNVKYIEKERREMLNPDEPYFKKLEDLSLKKINNMK